MTERTFTEQHKKLEQELAYWIRDSAVAWDKCEKRRLNEEKLSALIAELLDDPLILEGAPPGIGWYERAEEAIGRPAGAFIQKAINRKRDVRCNWCGSTEACLPRPDCGHPKAS